MPADDAVSLTDLEVIQQFSLAVRGATAPRAAVIAALQSDLNWLSGGRSSGSGAQRVKAAPEPAPAAPERPLPAKAAAATRRSTGAAAGRPAAGRRKSAGSRKA